VHHDKTTVHRCFFTPGLFLNGTIAIEFFGSQLITKETLVTARATGPFDVYVAGERAAGTPHGSRAPSLFSTAE
jgi:hypothetical protein